MRKGFALGMLAMFVCVSLMAAVNGVFANVNASTGYQYAGAAPANHLLVGNGTDYVDATTLPSASLPNVGIAGMYTWPSTVTTDAEGRVTAIASGAPSVTTTSTAGTILNAGSGCMSTSFTATGNYMQISGIYFESVTGTQQTDCASSPNNGQESIVLPHACPTQILSTYVINLAPVESADDTAQASQTLVSVSTTTVVTQRYRAADHGGSPSTPVISIICN